MIEDILGYQELDSNIGTKFLLKMGGKKANCKRSLIEMLPNLMIRYLQRRPLAKEINEMRENGYNTTAWMSLIELYRDISYAIDGKLIPDVQVRFERLIGKEVKYVKMQEPDDSDLWEIGDMATGAAANLQPLQGKSNLGEEEVRLNEYLMEILNYRLASLPDEAAWDFVAQSILSETKELG